MHGSSPSEGIEGAGGFAVCLDIFPIVCPSLIEHNSVPQDV